MKKKKIKLLVASMAVAAMLVGGTLAWFTFHQDMDNHFTTGSVKTNIHEKFDPEKGKDMQPGVKVTKQVSVENTGKSAALLRVKITPVWDAKGNLPQSDATEAVDLNLANNSDWIKGNDGYYYYTKVLAKGATSSQLLDSVDIKGTFNMTEDYQNRGLTVKVESDAIQTTNGAWQDAWKTAEADPTVKAALEKIQTANTATTTNEITADKEVAK